MFPSSFCAISFPLPSPSHCFLPAKYDQVRGRSSKVALAYIISHYAPQAPPEHVRGRLESCPVIVILPPDSFYSIDGRNPRYVRHFAWNGVTTVCQQCALLTLHGSRLLIALITSAHCTRHSPTFDTLPDDVLLDIFDFDRLTPSGYSWEHPWQWLRLVHVCKRWRQLIFSSPRRLKLGIFCSNGTPVKEILKVWPELPIVMHYGGFPESKPPSPEDEENLVTALREPDRISELWLTITGSLSDQLLTEMRKAMPLLESLRLMAQGMHELLLPDKFLGASAPHLSDISLYGIAFPMLPKLLVSSGDLTSLELCDIPMSGNISPKAIVLGLSAMTQLKSLSLNFGIWMSHFHVSKSRPRPQGRTVLPALTNLKYTGITEYLEAFASIVDTPLLELIDLRFFNRVSFEIPQLSRFITRTNQLGLPTYVKIAMSGSGFSVTLIHRSKTPHALPRSLQITCRQFDSQLTTVSPISSQLSPFFASVELLELSAFLPVASGRDTLDLMQWVELLRPFSSVERLCVADELVLDIGGVLQWAASKPGLELLPALRELSLGNSQKLTAVLNAIAPFIDARQLSGGHPIVVSNWDASGFH